MENYVRFWVQHFKKEVHKLESVQKKIPKMIRSKKNPDKDNVGLFGLEARKPRVDLLTVFKY